MAVSVEISESGSVKLPARLRKKYGLLPGTRINLIDLDGFILLKSTPTRVDELGDQIVRARKAAGLSVKDLLAGLDKQRCRYNKERRGQD